MCERCKMYKIQVQNLEKKLIEMMKKLTIEEERANHYMNERNKYIKCIRVNLGNKVIENLQNQD